MSGMKRIKVVLNSLIDQLYAHRWYLIMSAICHRVYSSWYSSWYNVQWRSLVLALNKSPNIVPGYNSLKCAPGFKSTKRCLPIEKALVRNTLKLDRIRDSVDFPFCGQIVSMFASALKDIDTC